MIYRVIMEISYPRATFNFDNAEEAIAFMETAMSAFQKDEDGNPLRMKLLLINEESPTNGNS